MIEKSFVESRSLLLTLLTFLAWGLQVALADNMVEYYEYDSYVLCDLRKLYVKNMSEEITHLLEERRHMSQD